MAIGLPIAEANISIIYINTQKIKYIVLVLFVAQRLVIKVVETVKIIKGLLTTRNLI